MAGLGAPKTGGRQVGTANKLTRDVREMVLGALADVGGQAYLAQQAQQNPTAIMIGIARRAAFPLCPIRFCQPTSPERSAAAQMRR